MVPLFMFVVPHSNSLFFLTDTMGKEAQGRRKKEHENDRSDDESDDSSEDNKKRKRVSEEEEGTTNFSLANFVVTYHYVHAFVRLLFL